MRSIIILTLSVILSHSALANTSEPASKFVRGARPVAGRYMVVLNDDVAASNAIPEVAASLVTRHGGRIVDVWEHAVHGFAVEMPEAAAVALAGDPWVRWVEEDQYVSVDGTQANPPAGLDRIDQRMLPLDATYGYPGGGGGVNVYVLDTGILTTHADFGGRAIMAYSAVNDGIGAGNPPACNGHGTHVAGVVAGGVHGVAKRATVYSVRVLDCTGAGYESWIVNGVEWVTANFRRPAVANMSLHVGASITLDTAVQRGIDAGITFVVAAANDHADACEDSPARVGPAITAAASNPADDTIAYFSNFGSCVDVYAPGVAVVSAWNGSTYYGCPQGAATCAMSGTSQASPHVAGTAALYLGWRPAARPSEVANALISNGTAGALTAVPAGSPDVLLFSPFMPQCGSGLEMCLGQCANLTSDTANCGACGRVCSGSGTKCWSFDRSEWWYSGQRCLDSRCVTAPCDWVP
jgi:subtilisin family serine protease